jgi:hypothetical protein
MQPLDARRDQSERESDVAHLPYEVGRSTGCMAPVVAPQKVSAMEITGTVHAQKKLSRFGSSSNHYADHVRVRGQSRHELVRCTCLLLTQSGHCGPRAMGPARPGGLAQLSNQSLLRFFICMLYKQINGGTVYG